MLTDIMKIIAACFSVLLLATMAQSDLVSSSLQETEGELAATEATHPAPLKPVSSIKRFSDGILALAHQKVGNYVVNRTTGQEFYEEMQPEVRAAMVSTYSLPSVVLTSDVFAFIFKRLSIAEGEKMNKPDSLALIDQFLNELDIDMSQYEVPKGGFKNFNEFFARSLKEGARPIASPGDPIVVSSAADCRLTVFETVTDAKQFWIKGKQFTVAKLLDLPQRATRSIADASVAIFRLATQDYHRFHSPVDGVITRVQDVEGKYYTVNPIAVKNSELDVFTENRRTIVEITRPNNDTVNYVCIGATLVGSIVLGDNIKIGARVKRGDEMGKFLFGGSTIVVIAPRIEFDKDLLDNSKLEKETLVSMGEPIGRLLQGPPPPKAKPLIL